MHPKVKIHPQVHPAALRKAMISAFSLEDLELLCADIQQILADHQISLEVNLEMIGGTGKAGKILKLIEAESLCDDLECEPV
jgi:hypothetical protein